MCRSVLCGINNLHRNLLFHLSCCLIKSNNKTVYLHIHSSCRCFVNQFSVKVHNSSSRYCNDFSAYKLRIPAIFHPTQKNNSFSPFHLHSSDLIVHSLVPVLRYRIQKKRKNGKTHSLFTHAHAQALLLSLSNKVQI